MAAAFWGGGPRRVALGGGVFPRPLQNNSCGEHTVRYAERVLALALWGEHARSALVAST